MLDARVALAMWIARGTGRAFRPDISVSGLRALYAEANARFGVRAAGGVHAEEHRIANAGGSIGARSYRADDAGEAAPLLVYFHGGGFCIGDVAVYDGLTRFFARTGRMAVLSVDYRLAPEHPFPAAHDDALAALSWAHEHAGALRIDRTRVAVGGDSAGGTLAAFLCAYAESHGVPRPAMQLLFYPSVDPFHDFPSARTYVKDLPLTPEVMRWFEERFVGDGADAHDPRLALLQAPHPERLPPTYLQAARYDPLLDEGRAYADRLRAAGVAITYDLRPTLPHAYVNLAGAVPAARRALREAVECTAATLRGAAS